jgi:integrase
MAMRTGIRSIGQFTQDHLDDFARSVTSFAERDDLRLYRGGKEALADGYALSWQQRIRGLQLMLYHRGNRVTAPRMSVYKRKLLPSPRPDLQMWADRWIVVKRASLAQTTTDHSEVSLRSFIDHLSRTAPEVRTFADVKATHMNAFLEAMMTDIKPRTGRPLSVTARRSRASTAARFLADGAAWGWPDFPTRPVLDIRNLPRMPRHVPRFIPEDELARLMDAIRSLRCPFQRAALLTARWSGARRGEIVRLTCDCLDRYADGTARLRIPAGKTMKERMVPLHEEAAEALKTVILLRKGGPERPVIDARTGGEVRFLFYRRSSQMSPDYLFQSSLKIACKQAGLMDGQGRPTISAHRFRHTVGTQLAERGAKLHTIMSVLGHQSPHMSMVYARISDAEVLRDYRAVLEPGAKIAGRGAEAIRAGHLGRTAVHWLKTNFLKTELELGHCLRLPSEGPCECDLYLSCAKFVTTPAYAPRLRERYRLEQTLAEDAHERKWTREEERHCAIARRIENLLAEMNEPMKSADVCDTC